MSLENIIDRHFDQLDQEFYDYLAKKMAEAVLQCGNKVPVVTGKNKADDSKEETNDPA